MRILMITDIEGANGIQFFNGWCHPSGAYYKLGCRFLTEEVNAVADGFFSEDPEADILVWDGHGEGAIDSTILDPRVSLQNSIVRWPEFQKRFDGVAFVGQHAKAGAPQAHLAHTQTEDAIDFRLNGISVGEFGQLLYAQAEKGGITFFAAGDLALTREAAALAPKVVTVAVKEGLNPAVDASTPTDKVFAAESAAIHYPRHRVLKELHEQAARAMREFRLDPDSFRIQLPEPPYSAEAEYRPIGNLKQLFGDLPKRRIRTHEHDSVTGTLQEFYSSLEWTMPNGREIVEMK